MIRGLDHFKKHFKDDSDHFVLIGGVATYLLLDEAGAPRVRPTKDLDIVLLAKPSRSFLERLKDYVAAGGYEVQKGDNAQASFYRFQKPKESDFPLMIELFAVVETDFELFADQYIIPVAKETGIESLSAILLDREYYEIVRRNAVQKNGLSLLNELALIPLKAKAYLEIKERGEDSKNWKKHRADVINLAVAFLTIVSREELEGKVREHFVTFLKDLEQELTADIIKGACKQSIPPETILNLLKRTFL